MKYTIMISFETFDPASDASLDEDTKKEIALDALMNINQSLEDFDISHTKLTYDTKEEA